MRALRCLLPRLAPLPSPILEAAGSGAEAWRIPATLTCSAGSQAMWRCPALPLAGAQDIILPAVISSVQIEGGRDIILPTPNENARIEGPDDVIVNPLHCNQFWWRIHKNQRNALKPLENASRADCGPRKKHWRWYRDRRIAMKKRKRVI
eukprot:TRINITY_DN76763_c0_g1_i1.p2 TRINITY_DN76763_c0_g1~~TRINITY_DN76763_c0_g1_i1.p2  ORF type:complete len:150 (+),score=12.89 TRINITY_DN76763_c0_g1_i1:83-532(+)